MLNAGQLDQQITLDEPVVSRSVSGDELVTFTEFATVWASVLPLRGREYFQGDNIRADMDTRIRIRWSPDVAVVNAKWRARHGDAIYNFVSVANVNSLREEIEIMAKTGVNLG